MPLGTYLESGVGEKAYKRLPEKFWRAERTELESISCQLDAKCSPQIWIHCLSNSSLLSEGLKIVRGKVKDGAGNSSQIEVTKTDIVADFDPGSVEEAASLED